MSDDRAIEDPTVNGTVWLERDGHVGTIVLDRPAKHNAFTPEMIEEFERVLAEVDADAELRAIVLAGAGEKSFCAGADIHRFKALPPLEMWRSWTRRGLQVFDRLASLRQPTIAAIHGNAYGGGLEVALACDLRVVSDAATLGLTEVGIGTIPGWGGTGRLRDLVGAGRAKQLILTGQPIDAATALAWGVANWLAPSFEVRDRAREVAEQIATRAPIAVQMAKQAVASDGAYALMEPLASVATAYTDDAAEGLASFAERRDPEFRGN